MTKMYPSSYPHLDVSISPIFQFALFHVANMDRLSKRTVGARKRSETNALDMQEIDPSNIVSRRTRGKKIDFAKEAEAAGDDLEDDEDDDEDFVPPRPPYRTPVL